MNRLVLTPIKGIQRVQENDQISGLIRAGLISTHINLKDGDILVIAQKIISKSEGRMVRLSQIKPSTHARQLADRLGKDARLVELILRESKEVLRTKPGTIIVEHNQGFVCANAGIDHSNVHEPIAGDVDDYYLLLPANPDASANTIREEINQDFGVEIGVMIIDSHGRAWRNGVTGTTIGISGVPALVDLRGSEDLFGSRLQITQVAAADELAAAASLVMGQAAEGTPVVHARGFPYKLRQSSMQELIRPFQDDLFR